MRKIVAIVFYLLIGLYFLWWGIGNLEWIGVEGKIASGPVFYRSLSFQDLALLLPLLIGINYILIAILIGIKNKLLLRTFVTSASMLLLISSLRFLTFPFGSRHQCEGLGGLECLDSVVTGFLLLGLLGINVFVFLKLKKQVSEIYESQRTD